MEIKDLNSLSLPRKIEKSPSEELRTKKIEKKETSKPDSIHPTEKKDQIEISEEARKLQRSETEIEGAKELLANLPSFRAHVIYEALAKLRAGLYSDEQILSEVAARLVEGDELKDLMDL
ncbi:MAG: hypothetical protein ACE5IR_12355 [bacterium]